MMLIPGHIEKSLVESTLDAFSTTASLPPMLVEGELQLKPEEAVVAAISLSGKIQGSIELALTIQHACNIVKGMM